jgi:putative FmdB family regulatory protein
MPIYTYKCASCGEVQDAFRSIANRADSPKCECGGETKPIIVPTQIAPVLGGGAMPGYQCPVTDKFVTSRRERREIMKRHGLVEKG